MDEGIALLRPKAVTVLGILNIVFGGLGILCTPFALAMLFFTVRLAPGLPVFEERTREPLYMGWTAAAMGLGLILAVVLVATGIGLLRLRGWARVASMAYAMCAILVRMADGVLKWVVVVGPMLERSRGGPEQPAIIRGALGALLSRCLGMAYPIVLLIFMTRPRIVAAFRRAAAERSAAEKPAPS